MPVLLMLIQTTLVRYDIKIPCVTISAPHLNSGIILTSHLQPHVTFVCVLQSRIAIPCPEVALSIPKPYISLRD